MGSEMCIRDRQSYHLPSVLPARPKLLSTKPPVTPETGAIFGKSRARRPVHDARIFAQIVSALCYVDDGTCVVPSVFNCSGWSINRPLITYSSLKNARRASRGHPFANNINLASRLTKAYFDRLHRGLLDQHNFLYGNL